MSASYFLSPHVHVCVAGKQVVLLDLERDKYLALPHAHPVGRWVRGWPVLPPNSDAATHGDDLPAPENALLAKMISQGLLVTDPALGKEASPAMTDEARVSLVEYDLHVRPRTSFRQLWNFFLAYAEARWSLKHRPIGEVVQAARLRKKHVSLAHGSSGQASTVDIATVRSLVTAFVQLRPLFYTARDACLLDSLTLTHFLARYGVFPAWVFGVKTEPFYPHCWIQQGDFVFNDTPDYIRGFSPILVV
jgi:hypothetical protein